MSIIVMMLPSVAVLLMLAQTPQPFPKPGASKPTTPATPSSTAPPQNPRPPVAPPAQTAPGPNDVPSEATLGVQIYPGAEFLGSFDAGKGQRYYLFGTNASFTEIVNYYRVVLKQKGELIFDEPAVHEFDIGKYKEETMAFPPSVTIKEYKSELSEGYPNPKPGGQPGRFPTVIQFVPSPAPGK